MGFDATSDQLRDDANPDQNVVVVGRKPFRISKQLLDHPPGGEGFERLMGLKAPWAE